MSRATFVQQGRSQNQVLAQGTTPFIYALSASKNPVSLHYDLTVSSNQRVLYLQIIQWNKL